MRIGCCVNMVALAPDGIGIERLAALKTCGYDYVELPLAQMMALKQSQFSAVVEYVESTGIPCEACNNFIPAHQPVTGNTFDRVKIAEYLEKAIERACILGAKSIVFGSAGAKNVPTGFPREKAWEQIIETLVLADKIIGEQDVKIAIEPLCRVESNIIVNAHEGLKLAQEVDRPNVKLLIDFYHLEMEKEDHSIIEKARGYLQHVHLANPAGRAYPRPSDGCKYQNFITRLKEAGYDSRISIEAYTDNFDSNAPLALAAVRDACR
ncbi:MAG: sugar phosphate isomerase/epimerase [Desulfofustis sp.]